MILYYKNVVIYFVRSASANTFAEKLLSFTSYYFPESVGSHNYEILPKYENSYVEKHVLNRNIHFKYKPCGNIVNRQIMVIKAYIKSHCDRDKAFLIMVWLLEQKKKNTKKNEMFTVRMFRQDEFKIARMIVPGYSTFQKDNENGNPLKCLWQIC